jgi:hypothetical protein
MASILPPVLRPNRVPRQTGIALGMVAVSLLSFSRLWAEQPNETIIPANQAKNLARLNCGAHIDRILPGGRVVTVPIASDANDNPAALVLDDNTLSCPLPVGENTFIVSLPRISVLERFAFINQSAAGQGEFELAVSNYRLGSNDPKWKIVQASTRFGGQRLLSVSLPGVEAKYVRLSFHVRKEGRLAGVALYGSRTLENFAERHVLRAQTSYSVGAMKLVTHREDTLNFNYANQYARARVAYVSSGGTASASRMIDDDVSTSFAFSERDPQPTVIIALADRQSLHRVSAVYQMKQGQVDVYVLDQLENNPADLSGAKLIASVPDQAGDGRAAVNFDPRGARYVALRWTPKKAQTQPIEVAEIAAFGAVPLSVLDLAELPDSFADISKPGESSQDFSNSLGTLADPPTIAAVSP